MDRRQAGDGQAAAPQQDYHDGMHRSFGWKVPRQFNIAQACCGRWAAQPDAAERLAVLDDGPGQAVTAWSYAQLQDASNRLANALVVLGVQRGDRVAIVMPQRFETAVAYMAVLQLGAVAVPLSMLFGAQALEFRLSDSEAVVAVCDAQAIATLESVRAHCPMLRSVIRVGAAPHDHNPELAAVLEQAWPGFSAVDTFAEEAAVLIYTSGTTGQPKGALVAHRGLIGNLSGFVCSQNWFGFDPWHAGSASQAVFWSPADWAWTGGLLDALLPTLYFGRPIVAWNGRFSPQAAFELLQRHAVTHTFLFPTALKAMMKAYPRPRQHFELVLQAIMSAGESVGDAVFAYCEQELGVTVNEMFGQTEINYVVGNCAMGWPGAAAAANAATPASAPGRAGASSLGGANAPSCGASGIGWPARPGSMGRPYPGHQVRVIDEQGQECPVGVTGEVAVNRFDVHGDPDPVFFLGYWKNPAATAGRFIGDWCCTGDLAVRDADGYLWYQGRADDVFKSAGYRIGPGEIENCLVKHPAVLNAAVVPKPDLQRGALVKAYVVLAPDHARRRREATAPEAFDRTLVAELQEHVRGRLAPYQYPKEIAFVPELPMTTTGKVQRRVLRQQEEDRARAVDR